MPQKLGAFQVLRSIMLFGTAFKDVAILRSNRIPNFSLALMNIIDGRKIQVFFMPTKKSLPSSNITIGLCDSFYLIWNGMLEQRVKRIQIPSSSSCIHKRSCEICPINWRRVCDCFPKLHRVISTSFSFSSREAFWTFELYF